MIKERKAEEFEDDQNKWKIHFDLQIDPQHGRGERTVIVSFISNFKEYPLTERDLEQLKQDLRDLGKFRIIIQGREFLGD